jgi:hypothetical protein
MKIGHKTLAEVQRYTDAVKRARVAERAMERYESGGKPVANDQPKPRIAIGTVQHHGRRQ